MAARVARSRAAAIVVLLAIALGALAVATFATASTSSAIVPPTDDDPIYEGLPLTLAALPDSITTSSFNVSGTADPGDDVTVEVIPPTGSPSTCTVTADALGDWYCTVVFPESGAYEVQAYRSGGLYLEHFDRDYLTVVRTPSFDAIADPYYWNAQGSLLYSGAVAPGTAIDFAIDGTFIGSIEPDDVPSGGSPLTGCALVAIVVDLLWTCTLPSVDYPLADGSHTFSATSFAYDGEGWLEGETVSRTFVVDTVAPGMATLTWPLDIGPEYQGTTGPLPRVTVSDLWPWFGGVGEPGTEVNVVYYEGDDRSSQLWEYAWPVCSDTVDSEGWWSCGAEGYVSAGTTWTVGTWQEDLAGNSTWWSDSSAQLFVDYVEGPVTPVITSPSNGATIVGHGVTISGSGAVGDNIALYQGEVEDESATFYCGGYSWNFSVEANAWSCSIVDLPYGTHTFTATAVQNWGEGGWEWGGSDTVSFTLVPPTTPTGPTTPTKSTTTSTPSPWSFQLTDADGNPIDPSDLKPGDRFFIYAGGLPPGATVSVELHSTPIPLGSATVDSLGNLRMPIAIPEDVEPGEHSVVATLTPVDGEPSTVSAPVVVAGEGDEVDESLGAGPDADPTEEPTSSGGEITATGSSGADLAQPSTFSSTLQTVGEVRITASTFASAAVLAGALIVFVSLPAELLQSTIGANYARAFGWLTPLRERGRRFRHRVPRWLTDGRVGGAITVAATALILGFADPTFTWNAPSFRLWAALFASLFVVNVVVLGIVRAVARRRYSVSSWLDPMPAALIVVALSVLVSRLAHIEPGFLFGLVVGVMFARELRTAEDGKLATMATALLIAFGFGAWLLFSVLPAEGGVAVQFTRDLLSATTLEAISTLLIALLPLAFLEGRTIFAWSKAVWVGVYAAAVTAFMIIVVPMSDSWGDVSAPLFGWVTLFAVFGLVALAVWALFRFIPEKDRESAHASS